MKSLITVTIWLLLFVKIDVAAQIIEVNISDFGAIPNDNKSDHLAFTKAAAFINGKKGNVHLKIKAGTYIVGVKPSFKTIAEIPTGIKTVNDVFNIKECNNVTIEGKGKAVIKFADGIPVGTVPNFPNNKDSAVHIGALFRFERCSNISLVNITADGNSNKAKLLNTWGVGPNPYEREHDGLFLYNCQFVTVKNVTLNYFCRDGCLLIQDPEFAPQKNISFYNCTFNYNGRDGVSWCGGENVSFYNCRFNNNCKGRLASNPGSGLDIEPERGALCKNGKIIKCEFKNNYGYAVVSGYSSASNVVFDSCSVIGNTNYALVITSPYFSFTNCFIAGSSLLTYGADTEAQGMRFRKCIFVDSVAGQKIFAPSYVTAVTGRYARFTECAFTGYKMPVLYTEITKKNQPEDKENLEFTDCTFSALFTKSSTWGYYAFLASHSEFLNCTFKTRGYASFKRILDDVEKNIRMKGSVFINK